MTEMGKGIYAIVGKRIREERLRAGLTLEALSEQADISRSFLAYIENNGRKASLWTVERIAAALHISPADLLRGTVATKRDPLQDVAQRFIQLVRDKSPEEAEAVLDVARSAAKNIHRKR
jgi:transcriptional regulator with XRE-family HTH domain